MSHHRYTLKHLVSETRKIIQSGSNGTYKEDIYRQLCLSYFDLNLIDRYRYVKELSCMHSYTHDKHQALYFKLTVSESTRVRRLYNIKESLQPKYRNFFINLGKVPDGIKLVVNVRSDLLDIQNKLKSTNNSVETTKTQNNNASENVELENLLEELNDSDNNNNLFVLSSEIKDLINIWFAPGFLQLERVTWNSSCHLLQRISELESVHPIRSWIDIKQRVGPYRRCYVFTHPCLPNEPIVILHTALCSEISTSIRDIVKHEKLSTQSLSSPEVIEDPDQIKAAIFYSISSPHRGLNGVDLGNTLIKRVVQQLRYEFPNLQQFSTLSPMSGFRTWFTNEFKKCLIDEVNPSTTDKTASPSIYRLFSTGQLMRLHSYFKTSTIKDLLASIKLLLLRLDEKTNNSLIIDISKKRNQHYSSESNQFLDIRYVHDEQAMLKWLLTTMAAKYLVTEKHRGFSFDPVCHFHLKNGATVWQINWLADPSPKGIQQSYGVMVNYRYFIENTESNSQNYLNSKKIVLSDHVTTLLKENNNPNVKIINENKD